MLSVCSGLLGGTSHAFLFLLNLPSNQEAEPWLSLCRRGNKLGVGQLALDIMALTVGSQVWSGSQEVERTHGLVRCHLECGAR